MINEILVLQIVTFLDFFAVGLILPLISYHARNLGADHVYVGFLGSIYAGFQLASGPLIGSFGDLHGQRVVLIVILLICSITYPGPIIFESLVAILIMKAISGLFKQTQTLTRALAHDYVKNQKKQSEVFGKMSAISGIGITLGPVVGGHLVEKSQQQGLTFIAVIAWACLVSNAGLVYILPEIKSTMTKKKRQITRKENISIMSTMQVIRSACVDPMLELCKIDWSAYGIIFFYRGLIEFAMLLHYFNYSLYLMTTYGLTVKYVGYVISLRGIIRTLSSYFISYINSFYPEDNDYAIRKLHVFMVLSFSILGLICSFNVYMYMIFLIPLIISYTVGSLILLEILLKKCDGRHRATLIGASNSVRSLCGVITPMVSGVIGHIFGMPCTLYVAFVAGALGALLSYQPTE